MYSVYIHIISYDLKFSHYHKFRSCARHGFRENKMKKFRLILFLTVCLFPVFAYTQDIITLRNGDEIQAKVTEVMQDEIKYKRFDNLEGPVYSMNKSEIFSIKYESGHKEVMKEQPQPEPIAQQESKPKPQLWTDKKPKGVSIYAHPLGFIQFGPIIGTEIRNKRSIADFHIRIPSLGLLMRVMNNDPDKLAGLAVGAGARFLFPQRIGGWYVGVKTEFGWNVNIYDKGSRWEEEYLIRYVDICSNGGYRFQFSSGFYINTGFWLGTIYLFEQPWRYSNPRSDYYSPSYNYNDPSETYIFGMLEFGLGFEF